MARGVSVRTNLRHYQRMKTKRRELEAIKRKIRHGHGRSSLFLWMIGHHAELMTKDGLRRMPWKDLCTDFARLGLSDGEGKPVTPKRAGETWRAVCSEIEARENRSESARRSAPSIQRSRRPADWEPPTAAPQPQPVVRGMPVPPTRSGVAPPEKPLAQLGDGEVEAKLAALKRQFAYLDRHIVQQPDEE